MLPFSGSSPAELYGPPDASTMKDAMQMDITELQLATNFGQTDGRILVDLRFYESGFAGMIADRLNRKWLIVGKLVCVVSR